MTLPPSLPRTPADALQVSSGALRWVIRTVTGLAERRGFWDTPAAKGAADVTEMSLVDNLRWIHKSRYPVSGVP